MIGVFSALIAVLVFFLAEHPGNQTAHSMTLVGILFVVAAVAGASGFTYLMTGRLTRPIENLKASTEAIASGNYDTMVSVDCHCEVGGLAESFRKMVVRLNDNVTKINTLAYEDGITGLPNRAMLNEILERNRDFSGHLLFIDLDRFKQVNDLYGHGVGDELLRAVSGRMLADGLQMTAQAVHGCLTPDAVDLGTRGCRLLFRFAGDEFVVLITPKYGLDDIGVIARNLIDAVSKPFVIGRKRIQIGASVGIAAIGNAISGADALKHADMAMYEAKSRGRGTYVAFDQEMLEKAIDRAELERDFGRAFDNDEFIVHYQPKLNLLSDTVDCYEALVRWAHPTRGIVYPGNFLEVVGTGDGLERIGRRVLEILASDIPRLRAFGLTARIAVNVCPTQFAEENFAENLTSYVSSLGLSPHDLELEVTESVAMLDLGKARQHVVSLKAAGFKVAIDDFGIGFSNLSQLSKVPYDSLKIDKSLIQSVATSHDTRVIVSAILGMAHGLGHRVVAEGVEDGEQLAILKTLGCDAVQGYFTGLPVSLAVLLRKSFRKLLLPPSRVS